MTADAATAEQGEYLKKASEHLFSSIRSFDKAVSDLSGALDKDNDWNKEPKIVVDNSYHIKNFAGKKPSGGSKVTFKKWGRQVKKIQEDESISVT